MKRCVLLGVLLITVVAFASCSGKEKERVESQQTDGAFQDSQTEANTPEGSGAPGDSASITDDAATQDATESLEETGEIQRSSVRIYFPAASGNGLIGELHEIFETKNPGDQIKQIIADLIEGPEGDNALAAIPRGTSLRQVYVLESGVAYLDFSSELSSGLGGGSLQELLTLYSIIDSVVLNVGGVRRVGLLVGGRPIDSLNGHLDLRRPLGADRDLILKG